MTKRFPFTTLYLLLTVAVVIASWMAGSYGLEPTSSLLSGEGVRWWVRSLLPNFASAPLGEALLLLFALGMARRCGRLRWSKALIVMAVAFAVIAALLLWGVFSGNLLSATAAWRNSPLQSGWLPLLCMAVSVPCVCYGLANGSFATPSQVLAAFGSEVARCAPVFLTLFVASQLVSAAAWSRLPEACGVGQKAWAWVTFVIYWLPFACEYLGKRGKSNKNE